MLVPNLLRDTLIDGSIDQLIHGWKREMGFPALVLLLAGNSMGERRYSRPALGTDSIFVEEPALD